MRITSPSLSVCGWPGYEPVGADEGARRAVEVGQHRAPRLDADLRVELRRRIVGQRERVVRMASDRVTVSHDAYSS